MKIPLPALATALALALSSAHSAEPRQKKPAPDAIPITEKKEPRSLSGRALPYKVKVTAVDEPAATFSSAGKGGVTNVFAVTEKTIITKDTKPATFTDLAVGSIVAGTRTRTVDGKWDVFSVNIQSIVATPKPRGVKKEPVTPAPPTPNDADKPEAAPAAAPTDAPKSTDAAKAEEPKPDSKPEEKKPE